MSSPFPSFPKLSPSTYVASTSFVLRSVGSPAKNIEVSSTPPLSVPPSGVVSPSRGFSHGLGNIPLPTPPQSLGNPLWGSKFQGGPNPPLGFPNLGSNNSPWGVNSTSFINPSWCNTIPSNNVLPWNSVAPARPSMPRNSFYYPRAPSSMYQMYGIMPPNLMQGYFGNPIPFSQKNSPFLETFDFLDLTRLTNDPINHQARWSVIPTKFPSIILKLNGNPGEDPGTHVMTFHLWLSSNSLNGDSIHLRLFQFTLNGTTIKWYVELPHSVFTNFSNLAMVLLTHFQFPIHYET